MSSPVVFVFSFFFSVPSESERDRGTTSLSLSFSLTAANGSGGEREGTTGNSVVDWRDGEVQCTVKRVVRGSGVVDGVRAVVFDCVFETEKWQTTQRVGREEWASEQTRSS